MTYISSHIRSHSSSLKVQTSIRQRQRRQLLRVTMELDGLSSNTTQLGEAARAAMTYISSHIRSHFSSLKVQTSIRRRRRQQQRVIMELDGLSSNTTQLGEAARAAITYVSSHIRFHFSSLKVQTSIRR
jgi:t-SNARE complex subunit (syntaxin)